MKIRSRWGRNWVLCGTFCSCVFFGSLDFVNGASISAMPSFPAFNPTSNPSPFNPGGGAPLGQTPGVFAPQGPNVSLPISPSLAPIILPALGLPPGSFSPASPVLFSLGPLLGGGILPGGGGGISAPVQAFSMGPATLLNQFSQPPMVPYGQVGVPPAAYNPSLGGQGGNPFALTCNYYFFVNCGASGGQAQNFKYSTR